MNPTKSYVMKYMILVAALILISFLAICVGSVSIPLSDVFYAIFDRDVLSVNQLIIHSVRIPRVLGAALAGVGLSVSGVLLQLVMNNSLAAPNIIGVNSGAGLAVLCVLVFYPSYYYAIPFSAFFGALIASLFVYLIAHTSSVSKVTVVLAGVAVSSLLNAVINAILLFFPNASIDVSSFMYGSLSGLTYSSISLPALLVIMIIILLFFLRNTYNILQLGDSLARSLGLRVNAIRFILILCSAMLAGSIVSYTGLLGFVGLIVPHIARRIVGYDAKRLIPFTAILGAFVVVASDLIGRILFIPYEIPVGIIMSFLGSPYFIYLLIRCRGGKTHADV
ncbi:MAG: iron ABC transporter permease [Clostridiales bacterium]|nr:iron ABC transporter permease [Clostridiales bacterium]